MTGWRVCLAAFAVVALLQVPASAADAVVRLSAAQPSVSLEGRLEHFADATGAMTFDTAKQQPFERLPDFRSLGYDTRAHWFHVRLDRAADAPAQWIMALGAPDLEEVDVWIAGADASIQKYALGYHRPYAERPLQTREFAIPVAVGTGADIWFRVRTKNAINVHAVMWQVAAFSANETQANFYRGLYFGILLIAITLYTILGTRLRDAPMAAYAAYLASQTLLHLGSSGYLPVLQPANMPWLSDALPRIGWLGSAMSIVLMWDRLLDLKRNHRHVHRLYMFTVLLNVALVPFALMPFLVNAWILQIVKLANPLNSLNFIISLALLVLAWWRSRRVEWVLYFVAFVIPAFGIVINTAVNQGVIQQNALTSNFYPLAMLMHVLVMSFGLAMRLRQLQEDKAAAERTAAVASQRAQEQRRFVAMLSHEFGNPLAAIDRAAQMIQIKTQDLPQAEAQRLAQIRMNAATLAGFVDNFLMTEALDHGALSIARRPCDIREFLESAVRLQADAARERIQLHPCPEGAMFDIDTTFLGIAIGNLLANALRYAPDDTQVELSAALDADGLRIRVADHGPGLSSDELDKLGTPYFRATSSLGKKGSGLGFHFTRHIVESHGGTLTARAREAGGLEVEIWLHTTSQADALQRHAG